MEEFAGMTQEKEDTHEHTSVPGKGLQSSSSNIDTNTTSKPINRSEVDTNSVQFLGNLSPKPEEKDEPTMACPFFRLDPFRYWRCYRKYELRRFSDVRQHLERCHSHSPGSYYCNKCQTRWTNPERWREHTKEGCNGQPIAPDLNKIPPNELERHMKMPQGATDDVKYRIMWQKLFPGPCPDPFLGDFLTEAASRPRWFQEQWPLQHVVQDLLKKHDLPQEVIRFQGLVKELIEELVPESAQTPYPFANYGYDGPRPQPEVGSVASHEQSQQFNHGDETTCAATNSWDTETKYSVDSIEEASRLPYISMFVNQLSKDMGDSSNISEIPPEIFDRLLTAFAWRFYEEGSNPFQWETAAILYQKRREIVKLLVPESFEGCEELVSDEVEDDEMPDRKPFQKTQEMLHQWIQTIDESVKPLEDPEDPPPFQLPDYKKLIFESEAYQWLQSKINQHGQLARGDSDLFLDIGVCIRDLLRMHKLLQKINRRRQPSQVQMTFYLQWNPVRFLQSCNFDSLPLSEALTKTPLLTGSWDGVQAATVTEFMNQTWPGTAEPLIALLQELVSVREGQHCSYTLPNHKLSQPDKPRHHTIRPKTPCLTARIRSSAMCSISATGGLYFVSEIAEQIGWLASALRSSPVNQGIVTCYPSIEDIKISDEGAPIATVKVSCRIKINFREAVKIPETCSTSVKYNPVIVGGYPILGSSTPRSAFELLGIGNGDPDKMNSDIIDLETLLKDLDRGHTITIAPEYTTGEDKKVELIADPEETEVHAFGVEDLRLIPYDPMISSSLFDKFRILFEEWLGYGEIDWYPLPAVNRLRLPSESKLAWKYGNAQLSIILSEDETKRYRGKIREVGDSNSTLPFHQSQGFVNATVAGSIISTTWNNIMSRALPWLLRRPPGRIDRQGKQPPGVPKDASPPKSTTTWDECFLCADKSWNSTEETSLSSIEMLQMNDDYEFYLEAKRALQNAQGGWLQRLLSWKSYNSIDFSQFFVLFDSKDLVYAQPCNGSKCTGYDFTLQTEIDPDIHMKMIGRMILKGLKDPLLGCNQTKVLRGIPKRAAPPRLQRKSDVSGWAFYAKEGLCLRRILIWACGIVAFGVFFVPIWLGAINKQDLQNAFAPVTFLMTLQMLLLAIFTLGRT